MKRKRSTRHAASPATTTTATANAFQVLMQNRTKQARNTKDTKKSHQDKVDLDGTFVQCPLCQRQVFHRDMDMHQHMHRVKPTTPPKKGNVASVDHHPIEPTNALHCLSQAAMQGKQTGKKRRGNALTTLEETFRLELVLVKGQYSRNYWKWQWRMDRPEQQLRDLSITGKKKESPADDRVRQTRLFEKKKDRKERAETKQNKSDERKESKTTDAADSQPQRLVDEKTVEEHVEKMKNMLRTHTMKSYEMEPRTNVIDNQPKANSPASRPNSATASPLGFQTASGTPIRTQHDISQHISRSMSSTRSPSHILDEEDILAASRQHALQELSNSDKHSSFNNQCTSKLTPSTQAHIELTTNMPGGICSTTAIDMYCWKEQKRCTGFSPSLLKSLLQKNVRMRNPNAAVRIAKELIVHSFDEFIRRITIIIIEDAVLHPAYPFLVWLMFASSKGFVSNDEHIDLCLQIVYEVANVSFKEFIPDDIADQLQLHQHEIDLTNLSERDACLIKSLMGRASFGGMSCDVRMLRYFALLWYFRLCPEGNTQLSFLRSPPPLFAQHMKGSIHYIERNCDKNVPLWIQFLHHIYRKSSNTQCIIQFHRVLSISKEDIMLSAVDMHCSSVIDDILTNEDMYSSCLDCLRHLMPQSLRSEQEREWVKKQVGRAVWSHRSSYNCKFDTIQQLEKDEKTEHDASLEKLFMIIKDELNKLSYLHAKSRLRPCHLSIVNRLVSTGISQPIVHSSHERKIMLRSEQATL